MYLKEQQLKKLIKDCNLQHREDVIEFIKLNPESLGVNELSRIAELVNNSRRDTAAYYTDYETLHHLSEHLPHIEKNRIRVLEPSVGVGNFLQIIIDKYSNAEELIIDVNDIDSKSIELVKLLNEYRSIPSNVTINYIVGDYLTADMGVLYDLVIGNPPFLKLNKKSGLVEYSAIFNDNQTVNIAGFFLQKGLAKSLYVIMILPKYFLSNKDFALTRERMKKYSIEKIIDFGEKGFKGVLIETVAIFINTCKPVGVTTSYSVTKALKNIQTQERLTSEEFPYWLLYRDKFFDEIACKMQFGIFKSFRDRQITNMVVKEQGEVQVLKSRNINRDGSGITYISGYDSYINIEELPKYSVSKYYERDDVFLSPNMTYYPRVIRKPAQTITNGSVAILENFSEKVILDKHLEFLSSELFEQFYRIARNHSTRSLNIDENSVFFFGLYD